MIAMLLTTGSVATVDRSVQEGQSVPPPRFTDPARRAKLASAFPEIDRRFRDFASRSRVHGIATA